MVQLAAVVTSSGRRAAVASEGGCEPV